MKLFLLFLVRFVGNPTKTVTGEHCTGAARPLHEAIGRLPSDESFGFVGVGRAVTKRLHHATFSLVTAIACIRRLPWTCWQQHGRGLISSFFTPMLFCLFCRRSPITYGDGRCNLFFFSHWKPSPEGTAQGCPPLHSAGWISSGLMSLTGQ